MAQPGLCDKDVVATLMTKLEDDQATIGAEKLAPRRPYPPYGLVQVDRLCFPPGTDLQSPPCGLPWPFLAQTLQETPLCLLDPISMQYQPSQEVIENEAGCISRVHMEEIELLSHARG